MVKKNVNTVLHIAFGSTEYLVLMQSKWSELNGLYSAKVAIRIVSHLMEIRKTKSKYIPVV